MSPIDGNTIKVNGLTFTVLEGNTMKDRRHSLHHFIQENYDKLLAIFAKAAKAKPERIQDVLHDILLQELEKEARGRRSVPIENPLYYLKTAALRELWRARRAEKRLVPLSRLGDEAVDKILEKPAREPDPLRTLVDKEFERLATELLKQLPLRQRYVLGLWCSGLETFEIAELGAMTSGNVRFHKHAAIRALREAFGVVADQSA